MVCHNTWLVACVQLEITDVQNGAEILVDDFDPEAYAKQTLVQKAEDARHHAARMLRQTKVHNPDALTSSHDKHQHAIVLLHFKCCKLCMLQGEICRLANMFALHQGTCCGAGDRCHPVSAEAAAC